MAKIYMAGAGGMLGQAFFQVFSDHELKCTDIDVNEEWLSKLDFRDFQSYDADVKEFNPDFLFHLGAHTSLEYCEQNPDDAYLTNTIAVEHAVNIANELDIPLLYISTAGIFDGKQAVYDDWDTPNPLGVYARSKYMGERYVVERCNKYFVCRAGWMMGGGSKKDKKFINKIIKQIENGAAELNIVDDKDGTPTYTFDFAETVKALIQTRYWGLYNMVCGGLASRVEVARELLNIIGRDDIRINTVSSDYFKKEYFAVRPDCERLVNKRLDIVGLNSMKDWKTSLSTYLNKDFAAVFNHK